MTFSRNIQNTLISLAGSFCYFSNCNTNITTTNNNNNNFAVFTITFINRKPLIFS